MKQRDVVELVAGYASVWLLYGLADLLGPLYGWPREISFIVAAGFSGFAMQQVGRRISRRRRARR